MSRHRRRPAEEPHELQGDRCFGRAVGGGSAALLILLTAGCSTSQDYTVPDSLCGREVTPDLVSPLLPPGEKITVSPSLKDGEIDSCHVLVDSSLALYIKDARSSGAIDAMEFAKQPHHQLRNPERVETGKDGALADNGAYLVDPCVFEGKKINYILEISLESDQVGTGKDLRSDIDKFAASYLPVGKKSMKCA